MSPYGTYSAVGGAPPAPPPSRADALSNSAALGVGVAASLWAMWVGRDIHAPTAIQKGIVGGGAIAFIGLPLFLLTKFGTYALAHALLETPTGNRVTQSPGRAARAMRDNALEAADTLSRTATSAWGSAVTGFQAVKARARSHTRGSKQAP